jgi:hypothetical protein
VAGSELTLSCPDGYTLGTGEADFYRDPGMRVPVALNVSPTRYVLPAEDGRRRRPPAGPALRV